MGGSFRKEKVNDNNAARLYIKYIKCYGSDICLIKNNVFVNNYHNVHKFFTDSQKNDLKPQKEVE